MNKKTEYIFGLSSLIGLIITVALTAYALHSGAYAPDAGAMIVSLAVVNVVLAIVVVGVLLKLEAAGKEIAELGPLGQMKDERIAILSEHLNEARADADEVGRIVHNIQDQIRDRVHELFAVTEDIDSGDMSSTEELIDLQRTNEMFYLFLVDNLKMLMDILTGDKCTVTIKIVAENDGGIIMLRTFMRDSASYRARKGADSMAVEYPYYENSAFKEILSGPKKNYYVSDNLSSETTYVNSNPGWKSLYNATLVCPIRMQLISDTPTDRQEYSVLGFVCVDNKRGGLSRPVCIELLASVTDSLFNHFLMLNHVGASIDSNLTEATATQGSTATDQQAGPHDV